MFQEILDDRGYKYYINKTTKVKYKENPALIHLIQKIKANSSEIKYASYRSAMKLLQLKKSLYTFCIPFRCAISIISKHKAGSSQESVSPSQLTDIIHDIYFATEKAGFYLEHKNFQLQNAISVMCNFFWNVFDQKRYQNISLMELKLTLLILCELPPVNTYHELIDAHFELSKDHNNCITRSRFEEFVNIFGKLLSYLGEPLYFERKVVSDIVSEVFENYPGINGISQFTFTCQFTSHDSTKFSIYTNLFLLLIRFRRSELVIHRNQCQGCHVFPIHGLRFKCQKCKGLSLCFTCFGKGFVNNRHSLAHRMFELSSNEKEPGKLCAFFMNFLKIFRRNPHILMSHTAKSSVFDQHHLNHHDGNSKLIENEHVELLEIDDDIEGTYENFGRRRGTIRQEVFNNSENLLILQRTLMEKLLSAIENIKLETEEYQKLVQEKKKILSEDQCLEIFIKKHENFLLEQVNQLKSIQEAMNCSLASSQNNKTIKSGFASPTTSLFLPQSTPYRTMNNILKESTLCKSMNGYELNKSYDADNTDFSVSDVSTWFQTKIPNNAISKTQDRKKSLADETFETKVANFRNLLIKVKEIIDDSYSDNTELARTTANLEQVVSKIIDDEEKKRKI